MVVGAHSAEIGKPGGMYLEGGRNTRVVPGLGTCKIDIIIIPKKD
jgi:hypothetical protein